MTAWEACRMGYATWCDTCRIELKRGAKAYLVGAALCCPDCFTKTKEGRRIERARKRPISKAEARYTRAMAFRGN